MTSAARYAIVDLPPGRVTVRVYWEARLFEASRVMDSRKRWRWALVGTGYAGEQVVTYLPQRGQRWTDEPDWWQPIDPTAWTWPGGVAPAPLADLVQPQMVSASGSRRWSSMADQAAAAAEIKADVEAEVAIEAAADASWASRSSRPVIAGRITRGEVKTRVGHAILTLRALGDSEWRFLSAGNRVNWPSYVHDAEDKRAQRENPEAQLTQQRWRPSRADLTGMDLPLEWFKRLSVGALDEKHRAKLIRAGDLPLTLEQRLVWWNAIGATDRWIAAKMGVHDETARRRITAVYEKLWRYANEQA